MEIKKESYNLSSDDRKKMNSLNIGMKRIIANQDRLDQQQKEWINNANIKLNHKIQLEDNDHFSQNISKAIINQVAPNVSDTFKKESTTIKNKSQQITETIDKFNKYMERYKKIAFIGVITFFIISTVILLITAMTNGVFNFLGVNELYSVIGSKIKKAEGFMTVLWFSMYFVPIFIWAGIVVGLGALIKKYMI